jgi:hypothetical protein
LGAAGIEINIDDYLKEGINSVLISIRGNSTFVSTSVALMYQVVDLQLTDDINISKAYNSDEKLLVKGTVSGQGVKVLE